MKKAVTTVYFILSLTLILFQPYAAAAPANTQMQASTQNTVVRADAKTDNIEKNKAVNINKADAETIAASINGVGLKKAKAIVAFRESNGPFKSTEELALVKGIGIKTVKKNEHNIKLK